MGKIIQITGDISFEELTQQRTYILYFGSESCNVCLSVYPRLVDLMQDYDVPVGKLEIKDNKNITGQLLIFTVPTILVFHEGKEVLRESRFIDFKKIENLLQAIVK